VPYYIYLVKPFAQLEKLAEFGAFSQASTRAKALRAAQEAHEPGKVKVIFADNEQQAEDLLCQIRDPAPTGDE
jgi:hypothetical protein